MVFSPPRYISQFGEEFDSPTVDCNYCSPSDVKDIMNERPNNFSIFSLNIRSCRKNFNLLSSFLKTFMLEFTVLVLLETWLTEGSNISFDLDGYKQLNVFRSNNGGGIKVLYRDTLSVEVLHDFTVVNNILEVLTFYIFNKAFKYLICCIYRSPSYNPIDFNNFIFNQFLNRFQPNDKIIIIGDLNLNLFNPNNVRCIKDFIDGMQGFNLFPVLTLPSMINENNLVNKYSLIDQIWSNFYEGTKHISGVIDYLITDHLSNFYMFCNNLLLPSKSIRFRLMKPGNIDNFKSVIQRTNFFDIYEFNDPDIAFTTFYNRIFDIYNSAFPIKTKRIKNNLLSQPWLTPLLKKCIKKKYYLYNLLKRGLISRSSFNKYKRILSWVTNKIRNKYYRDRLVNFGNDSKKVWRDVNFLLNRKNRDNVVKIKDERGNIFTGKQLASKFNEYFVSIANDLLPNIPNYSHAYSFDRIKQIVDTFYFYPTNDVEIFNVLKSLPRKGNVMFDIRPDILLTIKEKIIPIITYLFNYCVDSGVYPKILKVASVVPVYKAGSVTEIGNYRPISNLLNMNKIFEKLTFVRLDEFIKRNSIISENQFGFRKNSNTSLAIFNLMRSFILTFKNKSYSVALFLDLKKAFDLVNTSILMNKLYRYGFRGVVHSFLKSYLDNRSQYVSVNNFNSSQENVLRGVPQGSVLGPLFFNLFINDLNNMNDVDITFFADDAVFCVSDDCLNTCIEKINLLIANISRWLDENMLVANTTKTKLMLVTPRPTPHLPVISFNNIPLEWVSEIKYLGLIIDNKLIFNSHVDEICNRLSRLQGISYRLSYIVPQEVLLKIYHSLIYPIVTQNIIIWGGVCDIH